MIGILIGTNREDNVSQLVGEYYHSVLSQKGVDSKIFHLEDFLEKLDWSKIYDYSLIPEFAGVEKNIWVLPEYNGSFPGVVKVMIDSLQREFWKNKKVALTGVSAGQGGNRTGLNHLSDILTYLNVYILPYFVYLDNIEKYLQDGKFIPGKYEKFIENQIELLRSF